MNTVLVVEDEKMIRQGIVAMVKRSKTPIGRVLECRNGEEALQILREQPIDVMFTDIRMPKMDGLTLVAKLDELPEKPMVIVLSGYDEFSYAVEMMKHGVRDYILKPIKREVIETLLENLERELSMNQESKEEEERAFLNQLRYLMVNPEQVGAECWRDMENKIRRYLGDGPFRLALTSMAEGMRVSCKGSITLEEVDGGVLYFLPASEAERLIREKDERFCMGISKEHRSVLEIPIAYQEALQARKVAFVCKCAVEEYEPYCFGEKPELEEYATKFLLLVPTERVESAVKKLKNWYFEGAHRLVSPFQILSVTEEIRKELNRSYRSPEEEKCPKPLNYRDADLFLADFEAWLMHCSASMQKQTGGKEKMKEAVEYIQANYVKDLNMAMVSNYIGMNYCLFSTAFKDYTGVNFVNYLKEVRMKEAKRLLAQTDDKIVEIAKAVGYENDKHFMKSFKSIFGVSPSEYRKDLKALHTESSLGE